MGQELKGFRLLGGDKALRRQAAAPVRVEPLAANRTDEQKLRKLWFQDGSEWTLKRGGFESPEAVVRYERAFQLTSRHLRMNVVPRTVRAEVEGQPAVLQKFVRSELPTPAEDERFTDMDWENLVRIAVLHYVTRIYDGHGLNVVPFEHGRSTRAAAIDGELTFGASERMGRPFPNTVFDSIASGLSSGRSAQLPAKVRKDLAGTRTAHWTKDLAREGLTEQEISRAVSRLERIQVEGLHVLFRR